jgi:hypothetical protein
MSTIKKNKCNKKEERYFYFSVDTPTHEVSCYVSGSDTLLEMMADFTEEFGYGIEFNITEVSKEEFENAE